MVIARVSWTSSLPISNLLGRKRSPGTTAENGGTAMSSDRDRNDTGNEQPEPSEADDPSRGPERLPAIDPDAASTDQTAPPVDIDDRDAKLHHAEPPDVIELPDHAEPGESSAPASDYPEFEPEEATGASPDAATVDLQEAWQSDTYVDPVTEDVPSNTSTISTDVSGDNPTAAPVGNTTGGVVTGETGSPNPVVAPKEATGPARTVTLKAERDTHPDAHDPHIHETVVDDRPLKEREGAGGAVGRLGSGLLDRVMGPLQRFIHPTLNLHGTASQRLVLLGGALLILLALLANSAGIALIIGSAIVSILIVLSLSQQDVFEHESALLITGVGFIGGIIGIVIGTLGSWLTSSNWFDSGQLNYGAAGFGGRFANGAGAAPFSVWFLNGLILPLLALAAIAVAPVALRRMSQFRNEVMDGVILVGASAAGFAIGTALIYWAPMLGDRGPQTSVSDWTLTTIGVVLLRPLVITLAGAMLGAGIWRYMVSPKVSAIIIPAAGSIGAFLLITFGSIQLEPTGLWPELIWTLLIAAATFVIYWTVLKSARSTDRSVLGQDGSRMVCPNCHQLTPPGMFCANCGEALPDVTAAADSGSAPGNTPGSASGNE